MPSFAERIIAAHQAGVQERQQQESRLQQQEDRKLQQRILKHQIDRLKIDDLLAQRTAAQQQVQQMQTQPGATVPDTTPDASGEVTGGTRVLPHQPVQFAEIPQLGLPGYSVTPQTLQEVLQQQAMQKHQATMEAIQQKASEPFTLNPGDKRFVNGTQVAENPKPEPVQTFTPQGVMVDGKADIVLHDNQGNYYDRTTKKPIVGRITPYVAPRQKGEITPTAEAGLVQNLNKQWEAASKDVQALYRANSIMDAGIAAARAGDLNAGSQAVLVTFQKFLDPTSVVRESEYARSAAGIAMAERIRGWVDKLAQGGAGVPIDELEKLANLGKEINSKLAAEGTSLLAAEKERITKTAERYGIPPELAIPKFNFATPVATPPEAGTIRVVLNGQAGDIPANQWEAFKKKHPTAVKQ